MKLEYLILKKSIRYLTLLKNENKYKNIVYKFNLFFYLRVISSDILTNYKYNL